MDWYTTASGSIPFLEWVECLDAEKQQLVHSYIWRVVRGGSRKNVKYLEDDIWEIKIPYKHGAMRVYFGKTNGIIILLGGSKSNQKPNIKHAKKYWRNYVEAKTKL
ncbi:MAG: type II toxin-antitoxin system RelE/ParE family toxin [Pseudomonadota bacterium]|nr:type II toxin-antitoxin system RelE/ParE family toxin [Pseudomonadota bacterium]